MNDIGVLFVFFIIASFFFFLLFGIIVCFFKIILKPIKVYFKSLLNFFIVWQ